MAFIKRCLGLASFFGSAIWGFRWEAIRGILYERGWHMLTENTELLWHYGPPVVLVGIGIWLFVWSSKSAKVGSNQSDLGTSANPYWSIRDLFGHVRPDYPLVASKTVGVATFDDIDKRWLPVGDQVMKQLSLGRLHAIGREFKGLRLSHAGPIPPDFWRTAKFTYWFLDRIGTGILHAKNASGEEYADIEVNRAEALAIWPIEPWPDFKKWDRKDLFELYEAACLWFNIEPRLPMPERALLKYQEWREMIFGGGIPVDTDSTLHAVQIGVKKETAITPHSRIRKEVLETLAEHEGCQPMFLYPHKRGERSSS
jgi:hypothetical protein